MGRLNRVECANTVRDLLYIWFGDLIRSKLVTAERSYKKIDKLVTPRYPKGWMSKKEFMGHLI